MIHAAAIQAIADPQVGADNALDLWAYLIVGLPGTIAALIAGWIGLKSRASHKELRQGVDAIKESTVNDHARPVRYDVDDIVAGQLAIQGGLARLEEKVDDTRDLAEKIGGEVREDRETRRSEDAKLNMKLESFGDRMETIIAKHHPEDAR